MLDPKKNQRQKLLVQGFVIQTRFIHACQKRKEVGLKKGQAGEGGTGGGGAGRGGFGGQEGDGGGHTQHTIKAEEINKKNHTYLKAADLHPIFYGATLRLLLLTLPTGSAQ